MTRILLDQNIPRGLARHLAPHHVERAVHRGWSTLANGDLIATAEFAGFEVLITADQNLAYQQKLTNRRLAIVVLDTNGWQHIAKQMVRVIAAVEGAMPGSFQIVQVFSK